MTTIDNALTRHGGEENRASRGFWPENNTKATTTWSSAASYLLSADGYLMPVKKDSRRRTCLFQSDRVMSGHVSEIRPHAHCVSCEGACPTVPPPPPGGTRKVETKHCDTVNSTSQSHDVQVCNCRSASHAVLFHPSLSLPPGENAGAPFFTSAAPHSRDVPAMRARLTYFCFAEIAQSGGRCPLRVGIKEPSAPADKTPCRW
jgi:hypothetical protein